MSYSRYDSPFRTTKPPVTMSTMFVQFQFSVSVYLFARKKNNISTDIQNITRLLNKSDVN